MGAGLMAWEGSMTADEFVFLSLILPEARSIKNGRKMRELVTISDCNSLSFSLSPLLLPQEILLFC